MKTPSDMILAEVGGIEKVLQVARMVEGARRGKSVDRHDQAVQLLAADLILNGIGEELRRQLDCKTAPPE